MYDLKGFRQAFNLTQKQLAEILKCQQSNKIGRASCRERV